MARAPHPQYRGAQVQSPVRELNPHTANKTRCSTPSKKIAGLICSLPPVHVEGKGREKLRLAGEAMKRQKGSWELGGWKKRYGGWETGSLHVRGRCRGP